MHREDQSAIPTWQLGGTIPARFREIVDTFPHRLAFSGPKVSLTYAQFNNQANRLAHEILSLAGPGPGRVALVLDQGAAFYVSAMAALKTGKSFVSFDPKLPPERLREFSRLADVQILLTDQEHLPLAREVAQDQLQVHNVDLSTTEEDFESLEVTTDPRSEAFIIFTSGSTGKPKGVRHSHQGAAHNAFAFAKEYDLTADDRILVLSTPSVYAAHRDMFLCLLNGASAWHYPLRDIGFVELAKFLQANKITVYASIVTVCRRFLDALSGDETFPHVRVIKIGGEASYWRDVDRIFKVFPKTARVFTGFSMTETNLITSYWTDAKMSTTGVRVPVGKPIEGAQVEIVSEAGQPLGMGEVGEIQVTSPYLAIGYLNQPANMAQNFECLSAETGLMRFRTGDFGQFDNEGNLKIIGRADNQVKIRGYRVDLLEIETCLQSYPGLAECVVKCHDTNGENPKVVAYLTMAEGQTFSVHKMRQYLSQHLSRYMLPAHFVVMDNIPQTSNGKVDRQALAFPNLLQRDGLDEWQGPRNELDELLVNIWESRIGIHGIGIDDDFFDVGGDSLSATQLLMQIDEIYEAELNAEDILNNCNTIRKMSDYLAPMSPVSTERNERRDRTRDINFVDGEVVIENTNHPELYQLHAETGLRIGKPGARKGKVVLNNLGFRGPDISVPKPKGRKRIAFVGSSSVFDPAVSSNDATWPHLTTKYLQANHPDTEIDYVNAALPGYSTLRCTKMFEAFVARLDPDVVVIKVNDLNRDSAYLARAQGIFDGVPYRPSKLAKKFKPLLLLEKNSVVAWRQLMSLVSFRKLEFSKDIAEGYEERLRQLVLICQEGGRLVLLTECRRLSPEMSLFQQMRSLTSLCLYMPYMSRKGFLKAEALYIAARKKVAGELDCAFLNATGRIPPDGRHFADSTHFRDLGSQKMAEYVSGALDECIEW